MFREIIFHWARTLTLLMGPIGAMIMMAKSKQRFGRPWDSMTLARDFERQLAARQAYEAAFRGLVTR